MLTSNELIVQNKLSQIELRLQRLEKKVEHTLKIAESLRASNSRHSRMLVEMSNVLIEQAKAVVVEEKLPTLAEACFAHSMHCTGKCD